MAQSDEMKAIRVAIVSFFIAISLTWSFLPKKAKIFDCFPFFNEFEILKIRLHELNAVVDYFVLVESVETQRGHPKPLYFEENKHLFEPYLHKIIHVALRKPQPGKVGWGREHYQRNCIAKGLKGRCSSNDLILISDVDEIPRRESIGEMKRLLAQGAPMVRLHQDIYYYKINLQNRNGKTHGGIDWFGSVGTTYKTFRKFKKPQYFRDQRESKEWPFIWKGGWHFSSAGPNDVIRKKLFSVIEGSDDVLSDSDLQRVFDTMRAVPIDESFPAYVRENYQSLKERGFIANF